MMSISTSYAQSCLKITDVPVGHLASVYGTEQLVYRFSETEWLWFGETKTPQVYHISYFVHRVYHVFKNLNVS